MEKRGVAEVIVVILIILLVIAAFVLVWNVVLFLIKSKAADISIEGLLVEGEIEYYLPNEFAVIKVTRGNEDENIAGVRIDFSEASGTSYYYNTSDYPAPGQTKRYVIFMNQLNPIPTTSNWNFGFITSIALRYLFPSGKISMELDKKNINPGKNSSDDMLCLYDDADGDGYGSGDTCTSYASAQAGKSPVNGDCNPTNPAIKICGGDTPYCDSVSQSCKENKNYDVTSASPKEYWIYEPGEIGSDGKTICGTWSNVPSTNPYLVNINFNIGFFKDSYSVIYICNQGQIAFNSADCYVGTVDSSTGEDILKGRKIIAPYITNVGATISSKYCISDDYIVIKWIRSTSNGEAIFYKTNKEIKFSYNNPTNAEVGISYDNSGNYYKQIVRYGPITLDYKLTF